MKTMLEDLVRCPKCKGAFCAMGEQSCSCPGCGAPFPVQAGVVDLIPDLQFERSRAQTLMESPFMAKIYSGKLWRRSYWQGWLLGIQFDPESAIIMEAARVEAASTVLDLACASGIYTRLFAEAAKQGRVVGLDLSMPMLQQAVLKDRQDQVENVAYLRGSAMELPFAEACFDCVNCCGALHLFPDPDGALREITRVLKPGGRFTAATFRKREGYRGRADLKTAESIGVNFFTAEGLEQALEPLGMVGTRVHHDSARWMILSSEKS
jgi:SAM-dependent methyltransferase